jgi:4-amino-4-deoxy-L-arabinose transferase-like glycosyltransferase
VSPPTDPLERLQHALVGLCLAILASVPLAALAGRWLGGLFGDSYEARATVYSLLLLHVVVGAVVLFVKVARHETQRVSLPRVGLWVISLWLWPLLLLMRRSKA